MLSKARAEIEIFVSKQLCQKTSYHKIFNFPTQRLNQSESNNS